MQKFAKSSNGEPLLVDKCYSQCLKTMTQGAARWALSWVISVKSNLNWKSWTELHPKLKDWARPSLTQNSSMSQHSCTQQLLCLDWAVLTWLRHIGLGQFLSKYAYWRVALDSSLLNSELAKTRAIFRTTVILEVEATTYKRQEEDEDEDERRKGRANFDQFTQPLKSLTICFTRNKFLKLHT